MNIVIRADTSMNIGTGHVMRCLALSQACLSRGHKVWFVTHRVPKLLQARLEAEGIECIDMDAEPASPQEAEKTLAIAQTKEASWIVLDGYHFKAGYQQILKSAGIRQLVFDDNGDFEYYCSDLVLNQNLHASESLYPNKEPGTVLLLSPRYAQLRREFWRWQGWERKISSQIRNVLVTLGGADPHNATLKIIQTLQQEAFKNYEALVLIGASNPNFNELVQKSQDMPRSGAKIRVERDLKDIPAAMAWADIAISAGGTTNWELAFLGLPTAAFILADNQYLLVKELARTGVVMDLGWYDPATAASKIEHALLEALACADTRQQMAVRGQQLVDGYGIHRVLMHLEGQKTWLRRVQKLDCDLLWHWRKELDYRLSTFSTAEATWQEHIQWFDRILNDQRCQVFIAFDEQDVPVGQVRFDPDDTEEVLNGAHPEQESKVSISVDKEKRGLGFAQDFLRQAVKMVLQSSDLNYLHAYIRPQNIGSIKTFEKAGFCRAADRVIDGDLAVHYLWVREGIEERA